MFHLQWNPSIHVDAAQYSYYVCTCRPVTAVWRASGVTCLQHGQCGTSRLSWGVGVHYADYPP